MIDPLAADLMHALQFMERIAAAINATKKTKLLQAYMLCLDRVTCSIDAKHKGWAAVSVRVAALYKRVLKWCKNDSLQSAANPLAAVLLLRSSPAPDELLFFIAKRTKALQSDQADTSLRTLLALLRGNTRELEFPIENAQKSDYKRLPYARAPLSGFPNAGVALGMMLEAVFGRNCRNQLANSPALMDLAVELLLQVAAHESVFHRSVFGVVVFFFFFFASLKAVAAQSSSCIRCTDNWRCLASSTATSCSFCAHFAAWPTPRLLTGRRRRAFLYVHTRDLIFVWC